MSDSDTTSTYNIQLKRNALLIQESKPSDTLLTEFRPKLVLLSTSAIT